MDESENFDRVNSSSKSAPFQTNVDYNYSNIKMLGSHEQLLSKICLGICCCFTITKKRDRDPIKAGQGLLNRDIKI